MRAALAPAIAVLLALTTAATADTRADVTALIRAGDLPAIRAALAVADPAEARQAYAAFDTAHPAAGTASAALLAETPNDPAAQTARGWYLKAEGWALRGTGTGDTIFPAVLPELARLHGEAYALATSAIAAAPDLLPASDLLLSTARTTGNQPIIPVELDRVMARHATRHSLMLAALGVSRIWGGPPGWGQQACAEYAARISDVPDYTVAVCEVDVVFVAHHSWAERQAAWEVLPGLDHPILDHVRLSWALYAPVTGEDALPVLESLAGKRPFSLEAAERLDALRGHVDSSTVGPVTQATLMTELPRLREAVDFDPADSWLVQQLVDALFLESRATGLPVPRDEIDRTFAHLFALAPYDGDAWSRYGYMMDRSLDYDTVPLHEIERIRGFYTNGVYYTNQSADALAALDIYNRFVWDRLDRRNIDAMDTTGTTAFAKQDFDRAVVCPTVRTIRLFAEVCARKPGAEGCPPPDAPQSPWTPYLNRAEKRQACGHELQTLLNRLVYAPVPVTLPTAD